MKENHKRNSRERNGNATARNAEKYIKLHRNRQSIYTEKTGTKATKYVNSLHKQGIDHEGKGDQPQNLDKNHETHQQNDRK